MINQQGLIRYEIQNHVPAMEILKDIPLQQGIAKEVMTHLKKNFLSLVYYNTCRNLNTIEIKEWENSPLNKMLDNNPLEKVTHAVRQFQQRLFNHSTQQNAPRTASVDTPIQFKKVRLKGQEKCHFANQKCTDLGYTDDYDKGFCILENKSSAVIPPSTQKYGYHEITLNSLNPQGIYTLRLGLCIAILMVGIGSDGNAKKAALMHEDYSSPKLSVTDMFNNSFKEDLKNFSKINFFLIGGNGGNALTTERFSIHKSEINQLGGQYKDRINLCLSTDDLDSPNDQFQWDESNVFFSSVENSTYLWILQRNSFQQHSLEVTCVTGPELTYEKLAAYYRENILTQ